MEMTWTTRLALREAGAPMNHPCWGDPNEWGVGPEVDSPQALADLARLRELATWPEPVC